jgi:hypothetical protein
MSYHRDGGEAIWRGDRHRLILARDPRPPMLLQVEQGRTWETLAAPGTLSFCPAGLTIRTVQSAARHVHVIWADLYSTLLPELGAAASRFELHVSLLSPAGPRQLCLAHRYTFITPYRSPGARFVT